MLFVFQKDYDNQMLTIIQFEHDSVLLVADTNKLEFEDIDGHKVNRLKTNILYMILMANQSLFYQSLSNPSKCTVSKCEIHKHIICTKYFIHD